MALESNAGNKNLGEFRGHLRGKVLIKTPSFWLKSQRATPWEYDEQKTCRNSH